MVPAGEEGVVEEGHERLGAIGVLGGSGGSRRLWGAECGVRRAESGCGAVFTRYLCRIETKGESAVTLGGG